MNSRPPTFGRAVINKATLGVSVPNSTTTTLLGSRCGMGGALKTRCGLIVVWSTAVQDITVQLFIGNHDRPSPLVLGLGIVICSTRG